MTIPLNPNHAGLVFKYRDRVALSSQSDKQNLNALMCVGLHNWLPVNISVALHCAECCIDLAFVMMVSNQAKTLR